MTHHADVLVVGGGVIGLTSALELAARGHRVRVIDRQAVGQESSWAGAGMIPPGDLVSGLMPFHHLSVRSSELWPELVSRLQEMTGLDSEYIRDGALHLSAPGDEATAEQIVTAWNESGVPAELKQGHELPSLDHRLELLEEAVCYLPTAAQVRNPKHLQALLAACRQLNVAFHENHEVQRFERGGDRLVVVHAGEEQFRADQIVIATGAWTGELASLLDLEFPVFPVRGQINQYRLSQPLPHVIERGKQYLVPRRDGVLLVGSTEEHVGFDRSEHPASIQKLHDFVCSLLPELRSQQPERQWSGFRPVSTDGLPILGRSVELQNVVIASGHYRAGLSLSPVTGEIVRQLVRGESVEVDLKLFAPERFSSVARQN